MSDRIRVLHVDDEPDFADVTATFLQQEREGITVETATNATDGIERLETADIDCVVSDYDMPGRSGIEFLEAVREQYPDLPFILFTGKGSEAVASEAISAGVTDYLQKEPGTDQYTLLANRLVNVVRRSRAERARERHLEAIETAKEGISILDGRGRFVYVNDAYADLYGYSSDELVGEHWELLYRDADVDDVWDEIVPEVDTTGYWHGETIGLRADGSTFVEDHTLSQTEHGELVCTVRDASDQAQREHAIEELHATARSFMQATTEQEVADITVDAARDILDMPVNGVYIADGDALRPKAWTEHAETLIGTLPVFTAGDGFAWEAFETDEPRIYDNVSEKPKRLNPDTEIQSEIILPLGDHGVVIMGSTETETFDETDISLGQTLAVHATTALDRIDRDHQLRAEREFFDQALDTLDDLFYVIDPDGSLRRWNARVPSVTGYTDEEINGMSAANFFTEAERERVQAAFTQAITAGGMTVEAELLTAGGERIPYEFTGAKLTDTDGNVVGVVGIGRDITQRKKRERQLEQQNERLSEFTSIVSHDLRSPLTVAEGNLNLAQAECDSEHLDDVSQAHERMRVLIEDLLTFAREGERVTDTEPVALEQTATKCWQSVGADAATLEVTTDAEIAADPAKLRRLLENLFRNTVEHAGPDVTVTIGDTESGFYVADDGPGIPPGDRDQVFDAGYTTDSDGTGFGLNIVRRIAEAHDWRVTVAESEAGGARFEITGVETS